MDTMAVREGQPRSGLYCHPTGALRRTTVKINGTATLNAPRDRVWAALNDPAVLVRTIPGCEKLESVGEDRYAMTVTAGVASIKGTYLGDVALTDPEPPAGFTLKASGSGAPGTVNADVRVTLDDSGDGRTLLTYAADAVVGGAVGGVGQRVLAGVAKKTAGEFFRNVDGVLAEHSVAAVPGQAGSPALEVAAGAPSVEQVEDAVNGGSATEPASPARVFTRPPAPGGRPVHVDVRNQLPGVLVGAAIALLGVWIGSRLERRR
jgi:carbon monoxide dehydrogenase subunit G